MTVMGNDCQVGGYDWIMSKARGLCDFSFLFPVSLFNLFCWEWQKVKAKKEATLVTPFQREQKGVQEK